MEFQSTRPQGARPAPQGNTRAPGAFQSTRPQGARPFSEFRSIPASCFNPRARRGRDFAPIPAPLRCASFNPRARRGRDASSSALGRHGSQFQSTRPQGARLHILRHRHSYFCFNPRARRGRDDLAGMSSGAVLSFNPRARRGRDQSHSQINDLQPVSIHAPAGGAT